MASRVFIQIAGLGPARVPPCILEHEEFFFFFFLLCKYKKKNTAASQFLGNLGRIMWLSYVRVLFTLAATLGFHKATTPPHPPPSTSEIVHSTSLEVLLRLRLGQKVVKTICWAAALSEMAVVLSKAHQGLLMSRFVLSVLATDGCHATIQLTSSFFAGAVLTALGGYTRAVCYRALGKFFTFELAIRDGHCLVTNGPYGVVRHPGYTAVLCAVLGVCMWHASQGSWARECGVLESGIGRVAALVFLVLTAAILTGLMTRIPLEDAALKKVFGREWDAWAARVPYKLVPGIY